MGPKKKHEGRIEDHQGINFRKGICKKKEGDLFEECKVLIYDGSERKRRVRALQFRSRKIKGSRKHRGGKTQGETEGSGENATLLTRSTYREGRRRIGGGRKFQRRGWEDRSNCRNWATLGGITGDSPNETEQATAFSERGKQNGDRNVRNPNQPSSLHTTDRSPSSRKAKSKVGGKIPDISAKKRREEWGTVRYFRSGHGNRHLEQIRSCCTE